MVPFNSFTFLTKRRFDENFKENSDEAYEVLSSIMLRRTKVGIAQNVKFNTKIPKKYEINIPVELSKEEQVRATIEEIKARISFLM